MQNLYGCFGNFKIEDYINQENMTNLQIHATNYYQLFTQKINEITASPQINQIITQINQQGNELNNMVYQYVYPQLATDMPQLATDMPQLATDMPQLATDMPQLATDMPQLATDILI